MRPIDLDEIEFIKADGNAEFNHGVDCCINTLLKAPTLDVKPVIKGKWSFTRHYKDVYALCSACGAERKYDLTDNWYFCPNCGADMRESEDKG